MKEYERILGKIGEELKEHCRRITMKKNKKWNLYTPKHRKCSIQSN